MARRLWPKLGDGDVVVGDRGFLSYTDLAAIVATGAHAVLRVKGRHRPAGAALRCDLDLAHRRPGRVAAAAR
jgi:hypothetical protein